MVVLPLVPVMPIIVIRRAGYPYSRDAISASTRRALPGSACTRAGLQDRENSKLGSVPSNTGRPGRRGRVGKASAVGVLPRQADEYAPGRHRAGVTANGVHLDVAAALHKGAVQIFQQAAKHHRASLAFPPYYAQFCRYNPGLQVCQARLLDFLHPACYNS